MSAITAGKVYLALCILLSMAFLNGCQQAMGEAELQETAEIPQEQTVLNVYAWPGEADCLDILADAFEEENSDIAIQIHYIPVTEYTQQMMILRNSDRQVDCVFFPGVIDGVLWQNKGVLENLETYLGEAIPEYSEFYDPKDGIYMLPYRRNRWVVFYNKDLFDKRNVAYPTEDWTWEEYAGKAVQLTKQFGEDKSWGSLSFEPGNISWNLPARTAGYYNPLQEEDMAAFREAAQWCYQLTYELNAQLPYTEQTGQTGYNHDANFLEGDIGMYFGNDSSVASLNRRIEQEGINIHYDIAPLPRLEGEQYCEVSDPAYVAMMKGTEYPEAAMRFILFVTGEEGANLLAENDIIPAITSNDIKEVYLNHSAMPEHREYLWEKAKEPQMIVDSVYAEAIDIVKNEITMYFLQEQSEEKTFNNIREELSALNE